MDTTTIERRPLRKPEDLGRAKGAKRLAEQELAKDRNVVVTCRYLSTPVVTRTRKRPTNAEREQYMAKRRASW
jgi:ribonuclease PH